MLRVGVIGSGYIAEHFHLPAWGKVPGVKVVALCDKVVSKAERLSKLHGIDTFYGSCDQMFQSERFDVIDVCVPNAAHCTVVLQALKSGSHVIVEKPFATQLSEAVQIAECANQTGKMVMCANHQRFRAPSKVLKSKVLEGQLGEIYFVRAKAIQCRGVPQQGETYIESSHSGGGPLIDLGSHLIDLSCWVLEFPEVKSVNCTTFRQLANIRSIIDRYGPWKNFDIEESAIAQVKFQNGTLLTLETSYLLNASEDSFSCEFMGTKGGLMWPEMLLSQEEQKGMTHLKLEINESAPASVAEFSHFIDCIIKGKIPSVTLQQSLKVVAIVDALYRSAKEQSEIQF